MNPNVLMIQRAIITVFVYNPIPNTTNLSDLVNIPLVSFNPNPSERARM